MGPSPPSWAPSLQSDIAYTVQVKYSRTNGFSIGVKNFGGWIRTPSKAPRGELVVFKDGSALDQWGKDHDTVEAALAARGANRS